MVAGWKFLGEFKRGRRKSLSLECIVALRDRNEAERLARKKLVGARAYEAPGSDGNSGSVAASGKVAMAAGDDSEPVTPAMIAAGLSQLPPMDETVAPSRARSGFRSKAALAINAGGNFGRAPDNRRPRGYDLRGPQRLPLQGRPRRG